MNIFLKSFRFLLVGLFSAFALGVVATAGMYVYLAPRLPSIEVLKDVRLQVPLRVYSADGALIAEFGEKKRSPLQYEDVPESMVKAILAAEDDRFFEHPGVDYQGILRAALHLLRTGEKGQGGSTITMQVARNFFLSREKTYLRKISEIFLALKIERELTKKDILELYINKIYLGNRAYGVAAAAQVYYGKPIDELTVAQMAMIAGLPKAPSKLNPIAGPERARSRRAYVLRRMHDLGFLDDAGYEQALAQPLSASLHASSPELEAPYVAEMVRAEIVRRYGGEAYTSGYRVVTTVDTRLQRAANAALRKALLAYDQRHGYRGPEAHVELSVDLEAGESPEILDELRVVGGLEPGVVVETKEREVLALRRDGEQVTIPWAGLSWARPRINENRRGPAPQSAGDILQRGDIIRLERTKEGGWRLAQVPEVEGALVALAPRDGAVRALAGGFDFFQSKFNRATQARRQPGSNFKPFVYSAALENGFTPASIINDAPVVFEDPGLEDTWRPENYSGKFFGPTRLRVALTKSRNLVSIRLLRAVGIRNAIEHIARFGFDKARLPRNLSLALGSASFTPVEIVTGYAVLANGGYRVEPHFIWRVEDADGEVLERADPLTVCPDCGRLQPAQAAAQAARARVEAVLAANPAGTEDGEQQPGADMTAQEQAPRLAPRVVSPQNVYLMTSMLQDVIRHGTGRGALRLGRADLAGKTGTTNEQRDAWFSGFNKKLVATTWVGFDKLRPLGRRETGARAALPMWAAFMGPALKGVPEQELERPAGLVTVRIDPRTGLLAGIHQSDAIFETFRVGHVPERVSAAASSKGEENDSAAGIPEQLF